MTRRNKVELDSNRARELADDLALDMDEVLDRLEGRGGGLRTSKPTTDRDTGLIQYVWRMATFHAGHNTDMPVTASWWLADYVEDETTLDCSVSGVMDETGKEVTSLLHAVARIAVVELGGNPNGAVERYDGVLY